jgi:hypothetical protein
MQPPNPQEDPEDEDDNDGPSFTLYGETINPFYLSNLIDYLKSEMSQVYQGMPIPHNHNLLIMSHDLTVHLWGTPYEVHAQILEATNVSTRILN